jgi:hypothetical protein
MGAMIVGGWDPEGGGQIYGVPISGTLVQQDWTTDGSGSTYIWGYLDSAYRYTLVAQTSNDVIICMLEDFSGTLQILTPLEKSGQISSLSKRHQGPLMSPGESIITEFAEALASRQSPSCSLRVIAVCIT